MRSIAPLVAALAACQGCSSDEASFGPPVGIDGGDGASGAGGAVGSGGKVASGGAPGSGGKIASGGAGGIASGGAGGSTSAGGQGGGSKPCPLDSTACTSCLGPICPDAIQGCGTNATCLDSLSTLTACVCPKAPNGKTSDVCLVDLGARGALEAAFAKCLQTSPACRSLCGL